MRCESFISKSKNFKTIFSFQSLIRWKVKISKNAIRNFFWKSAVRVVQIKSSNEKQKLSFLQGKMNQNEVFYSISFFKTWFFQKKSIQSVARSQNLDAESDVFKFCSSEFDNF